MMKISKLGTRLAIVGCVLAAACRGDRSATSRADSLPPSLEVLRRPASDTAPCLASFEVDHMPEVDPSNRVHPAYPESLRGMNVEGSVTARFVVDTTGRVDSTSFRVINSSHRYFEAAVRRVLPRLHYLPAEKAGKPVRCWTDQRFDFSLQQ